MKLDHGTPGGGEGESGGTGDSASQRATVNADASPWDHDLAAENQRTEPSSLDSWEHEDSVLFEISKDKTLYGRIRYLLQRSYAYLIRLRGSPEEVAWGLAIGLFIAMTPTVGLQMLIAVPVATALRGNPAAAAVGVWLTNPLTIPFLYGLNYWVGATILGYDLQMSFGHNLTFEMLLDSGSHVWWSLLLGGVITGAFCGAVGYFPALLVIRAGREQLRRRRERREARKRAKLLAKEQKAAAPSRRERRKRKKTRRR